MEVVMMVMMMMMMVFADPSPLPPQGADVFELHEKLEAKAQGVLSSSFNNGSGRAPPAEEVRGAVFIEALGP
jgi:hypothetical protein